MPASETIRYGTIEYMDEIRFTLSVTGPDPDDLDSFEDATRSLRSDLLEIRDLAVSDVLTAESPAGTRSGLAAEFLTGGGVGLAVTYYGGRIVLGISRDVARVLQDWQSRNKGKRVVLKHPDGSSIELNALSERETMSVLEALKQKNESSAIERE